MTVKSIALLFIVSVTYSLKTGVAPITTANSLNHLLKMYL